MVRRGEVGPIMLGRDHHDVSGTDSPFRETSNIKDGSNVMADMAVQCFAGNCARGMSLVALHNGGGVGIGKAINGGFGMVCDGSERVDRILRSSMLWDVMGGVARRSWARNPHAMETSAEFNESHADGYHITLPHIAEDDLINKVLKIKESTNQNRNTMDATVSFIRIMDVPYKPNSKEYELDKNYGMRPQLQRRT